MTGMPTPTYHGIHLFKGHEASLFHGPYQADWYFHSTPEAVNYINVNYIESASHCLYSNSSAGLLHHWTLPAPPGVQGRGIRPSVLGLATHVVTASLVRRAEQFIVFHHLMPSMQERAHFWMPVGSRGLGYNTKFTYLVMWMHLALQKTSWTLLPLVG